MYQKTVLDNGLRIITTAMPYTRSVGGGIFAGVGSRYETQRESGISHFIEHMMFKGTDRRPEAQQIAEAIESIGGVMNASTDYEITDYWAKVADRHLALALDVLTDMLLHSRFTPADVERERQVITQEINRLRDKPESWVHVLITELIWPDHPIGWSVAGTKETIGAITRDDLLDYVRRTYTPGNMVISLAGNLEHNRVAEQLAGAFAGWQAGRQPTFLPAPAPVPGPRTRVEFRETEQAQLCLGLRGISSTDPDRFPLRILNAVLGEGMSSRLFLEIREKRGLAYSVGSYIDHLRDTGGMVLYAGVPPENADDAIGAMIEQLDVMRKQTVPDVELAKAKEFTVGRLLLAMEDTFANASWVGSQEVRGLEVLTVDEVTQRLNAVTAADVQRIAQQLFSTANLNLAVVGPFRQIGPFEARLAL